MDVVLGNNLNLQYIHQITQYLCDNWFIPLNSIYPCQNMQYLTDSSLNRPTSLLRVSEANEVPISCHI